MKIQYNKELLDWFNANGYQTIPIESYDSKRPYNGFKWSSGAKWNAGQGERGFAVVTPPGQVQIDCDDEDSFNRVVEYLGGELPAYYRETPRGFHIPLKSKKQWVTGKGNTLLGKKIDIRAAKTGYAIVSCVDDNGKELYEQCGHPKDIEGFKDAEKHEAMAQSTAKAKIKEDKREDKNTAFDWMPEEAKISEGERNDLISKYIYATAMRTSISNKSLMRWSQWLNEVACQEPLTSAEITAIVNSTCKHRQKGNKQVWVNFKHNPRLLKASSGVIIDVLKEGITRMGVKVRFNKRLDRVEIDDNGWRQMTDNDYRRILYQADSNILTGMGVKVKRTKEKGVHFVITEPVSIKWTRGQIDSVLAEMYRNDEVDTFITDYLDKLPEWDGVKRVDTMLDSCFELTDKNGFDRVASRNIMIGAVARVMEPGVKHDECVILIGPEGCGKSTFCQALVPNDIYYKSGFNWACGKTKMVEETMGKVIVEASEMVGMSSEIEEKIKETISTATNTVRLSYRRDAQEYPCSHIFIGTSNTRHILPYVKTGGNRRFIPVEVRPKKVMAKDWIEENRDQLWAEAMSLYANCESAMLEDEDARLELSYYVRDFCQEPTMEQAIYDWVEDSSAGDELREKDLMEWLTDEYEQYISPKNARRVVKYTGLIRDSRRLTDGTYIWIRRQI